LTLLILAGFVVSTIPGVRSHPGYNVLLDGVLNNVVYAMAALLCFVRARRAVAFRPSWYILAVGLALYGSGNIYWTIAIRPLNPEPFPSIADALWLSFYPLAFIALVLILREHSKRFSLSLLLDGVVGGCAAAAVAAAAILGPILSTTSGGTAAIITTTTYPLVDLLLLFMVVATLSLYHWRPPTGMWMLVAGLLFFAVADVVYLLATAHNTYHPGGVDDAAWASATVLMAFAPGWDDRLSSHMLSGWSLLAVPVVSTMTALALLVFGHAHPIAIGLAAATIVLSLGRMIMTFRQANNLAGSHELALTDDLTSLGNRRALYVQAESVLAAGDTTAALLLLDLDRFKEVNDSLGHHAGDELLRMVATRLRESVSGVDTLLVRLGGDEFAVFLLHAEHEIAERVAIGIRADLALPYLLEDVTVQVNASIGIALAPHHGADMSALLRHADIAMYRAKAQRTGYSLFSSADGDLDGLERLRMIDDLRVAIATRALDLHYQPKVDATSFAVLGVEALVRWNHSTKGVLYPAAFLPLVEDAGLMHEMTIVVLERSLDQAQIWEQGGRPIAVAVNLSPSSLVDMELPRRIERMLLDRQLDPSLLTLEITEDVIMGDRERARQILERLREVGVQIAVDDFGTGYSSLSYLQQFPIDELKLDRSFIANMGTDDRSFAIVKSVIDLAHSLGLRIVAEGVENERSAILLSHSGCDEAQGYFFSRPLPIGELDRWLAAHDISALASNRRGAVASA
jgi:diguanylate cyclase (GGDEF)-like protein